AFGTVLATSEVRNASAHGVLQLTLHAASYTWQFVPVAGQTFRDSGSAACVGGTAPTATPSATPQPTTAPPTTPTATPTTNLALNKATAVSSFERSSLSGDKAVDGDRSTYWRSKRRSQLPAEWITVDLGGSVAISRVILRWNQYYATNYRIQVSADNANWTTVFSTGSGNGGTDTITFAARAARYVRMYSTDWNRQAQRNWLNEIEIYQ
ncbi:MAG TPA: discoidin domain-containing protein, partial [Roseiflexaceae bacterium]|nr:discoidin domain-containing protein [Roseiflexaceae bacterium]